MRNQKKMRTYNENGDQNMNVEENKNVESRR